MISILIGSAVVLFAASASPTDLELRGRVERAPKEVSKFIERRANCNHFLGEEPYDRERAAELNRAIRALRCERLSVDERRLHLAYRDNPAMLRLLDDTTDLLGW